MSVLIGIDKDGNRISVSEYDKTKNGIIKCIGCKSIIFPKRGQMKVHHYAHAPNTTCNITRDHDCKTDWHMMWQNIAKPDYIEVIIKKGINYHIADITNNKLVIEIQHSPISSSDIAIREAFYDNMIWILDGRPTVDENNVIQEKVKTVFYISDNYQIVTGTLNFWNSMTKKKYIDTGERIYKVVKMCRNNICICKSIEYIDFLKKFYSNIMLEDINMTIEKLRSYDEIKIGDATISTIKSNIDLYDENHTECIRLNCCYNKEFDYFSGDTFYIRFALKKAGYLFENGVNGKKWIPIKN